MTTQVNPNTRDEPQLSGPPVASQPATTPILLAGDVRAETREPLSGWRLALGAGLAFIAGLTLLLPLLYLGTEFAFEPVFALLAVCLVAIAAGYVSRSWWALPALVAALAAGGWAAGIVWEQVVSSPAGGAGYGGAYLYMLALILLPAAASLITGTVLGGMGRKALEGGRTATVVRSSPSQWALALSLPSAGGFFAGLYYFSASTSLFDATVVLLASVTCLLAGFVLRSWLKLLVAPVAYLALTTFVSLYWVGADFGLDFALFVALPAVLMSALGTALGMYASRRKEPRRATLAS